MLFNFALEYGIRRVKANQYGLKLNGTYHFLVYAADVNAMGRRAHTIKKITEALVGASKETGLQINADKTQYMITSRDQIAGQNHNKKT